MSAVLLSYLRTLFGREDRSDCTLVFYHSKSNGDAPACNAPEQRNTEHLPTSTSADKDGCTDPDRGNLITPRGGFSSGSQENAPDPKAAGTAAADAGTSAHASGPADAQDDVSKPDTTERAHTGEQGDGTDAVAPNTATAAGAECRAVDTTAGDPIPAHLLIICPGSAYFDAQVARWSCGEAAGGSTCSGKPQLRVPLNSPDDLPYTLSAVRFIYTGDLQDAKGAADLLRIRRKASYLQVAGCVEACDAALLALAAGNNGAGGANGLSGVSELYTCRQLLPAPDEEPRAAALLGKLYGACRAQLLQHSGGGAAAVVTQVTTSGASAPSLGELLGWAFRDAPSALSDPDTKRQVRSLPVYALEALLGSDNFATDDEATVLLLLAEWLAACPSTPSETRTRLCKLVRLCQMDVGYLLQVVPLLEWFPISRAEHAFLCHYVGADSAKRTRLTSNAEQRFDCKSAWYTSSPRPQARSDRGHDYEWSVTQKSLLTARAAPERTTTSTGQFCNGATATVANGFEWDAYIDYKPGAKAAGVFLQCKIPSALGIGPLAEVVMTVCPGAARLAVHRWSQDGTREDACSLKYGDAYVGVGKAWGLPNGAPLAAAHSTVGAALDPLVQWAAYLRSECISGSLIWE